MYYLTTETETFVINYIKFRYFNDLKILQKTRNVAAGI